VFDFGTNKLTGMLKSLGIFTPGGPTKVKISRNKRGKVRSGVPLGSHWEAGFEYCRGCHQGCGASILGESSSFPVWVAQDSNKSPRIESFLR
jgi:hypothetical protein